MVLPQFASIRNNLHSRTYHRFFRCITRGTPTINRTVLWGFPSHPLFTARSSTQEAFQPREQLTCLVTDIIGDRFFRCVTWGVPSINLQFFEGFPPPCPIPIKGVSFVTSSALLFHTPSKEHHVLATMDTPSQPWWVVYIFLLIYILTSLYFYYIIWH